MADDRAELTSYEYRKIRARILAESDVCIVCGHPAADTCDHIEPVAKRPELRLDPDNMAPIHGIAKCPTCLRNCNGEKSDKALAAVTQLVTSVDWFAGP